MTSTNTRNSSLQELLKRHALFAKNPVAAEPDTIEYQDHFDFNEPANLERYRELVADPNLRPYAEHMVYLENKPYPSDQDDYELELLQNPATRLYAERLAYLHFKSQRSDQENYEYALLNRPQDRPYAHRMAELYYKPDRTQREYLELRYLVREDLRDYKDRLLSLYDKCPNLTEQEWREVTCMNNYTGKYAQTIAELEFKDDLTLDEQSLLARCYLKRICHIQYHSIEDLKLNYHSVSYHPIYNCETKDFVNPNADLEIARFLMVEKQILFAAQTLAEVNMRHLMQSYLNANGANEQRNQIFNNPKVQDKIEESKRAIALAICKYYHDRGPSFFNTANTADEFNGDKLNLLVNTMRNALIEGKVRFKLNDLGDTESKIKQALQEVEAAMKIKHETIDNEPNTVKISLR